MAIVVTALLPYVVLVLVSAIIVSVAGLPSSHLWLVAAGWGAGVIVLSALVGFSASKELLWPLTQLARQIRGFPTREQNALEPVPQEPAEVSEVREGFNKLLARIELEQSRRSAFTATLMHDLKTPLVATSHLLEVIRDTDDLGKEERISLVNSLLHENHALIDLMQKLIDAHKFDLDEVPLSKSRVDLAELLHELARRLAPFAQQNRVTVTVSGRGTAFVDRAEIIRAGTNLLENAIRYARSEIRLVAGDGWLRVEDDGPGLAAPFEQLSKPFQELPVEISGKSYSAGTAGLGLYIAKRVFEAHGGKLRVVRTGENGTVFEGRVFEEETL